MPRNFRPSDPERFGLTTNCVDVGPDFVHCALAATKRPPIQMFPPVGLLYTVVQGSLLLISWPHTEHNFEAWLKAIRTREQIDEWDVLDELENPRINMLSTGDSVYLAAGTIDVMMALSHVALTSRTIFNPASQELKCISRTCHRLIDAFIERQRIAFSPSDFREAKGMSTSFVLWTHFVSDWFSDKTGKTPRHGTSQQDLIDFCYDITRVWTKVGLYFELVREAGEPLRPLPAERLRVQPLRAPRPGARAQANVADNRPDNGNALAALCRLLQPRFSF
ncbi:hypothetical protein PSEUBRA_006070 [Kalmanozyma brasiliensis GHG001]|uniref:uncharacterized protein n=1 Tax=Kalmanozyma brasiliensis (strain GHG001) TaxID=1365824 RepID=UPI001CE98F71|nr:uncharacterized protein PSEUBRA_006070 [Kalmanozyma brasiliensis GHG001]KAF6767611.1 hypothetical protein PSEUBRA_006070 [Kalmanozyma brasiliensis GHG001]